jgi:hypothetical protein
MLLAGNSHARRHRRLMHIQSRRALDHWLNNRLTGTIPKKVGVTGDARSSSIFIPPESQPRWHSS